MKLPWFVKHIVPFFIGGLLLCACSAGSPSSNSTNTSEYPSPYSFSKNPKLTLEHRSDIFTVVAVEGDLQVLQDVAEALKTFAPQVRQTLDYDYQDPVTVELFPDQNSLDKFGMNPIMQGYYAYSGDYRIQMVSPRKPTQQLGIDYSQRVLIAVHEFAHLVNSTINPDTPIWLNEGVAIYAAPHDLYDSVCQNAFSFEQKPTFEKMELSYNSVQTGDLFAYSLIEYISNTYGQETLNRLLRNPSSFEKILGVTHSGFELGWRQYLDQNCAAG
jgi:hypothetical protein